MQTLLKVPEWPDRDSSINTLLGVVRLSLSPKLIGNNITDFLDIAQSLFESINRSSASLRVSRWSETGNDAYIL